MTILPYPVGSGDRNQLKPVFINLISSAQAADPIGVVTWAVQLLTIGPVTVSIHSGGKSIAPELLPSQPSPFTTKTSGNSLGLAIAKRIVEAHQGQLTITSTVADAEVMIPAPSRSRLNTLKRV
ncbi:ATP-binding protein [Phormidium tenue]|uniref:ATP-binding protein n=1 Tax=Phormidium tenue TaxID=126344 RepID=UPI00168258B9|nr:ATP-binding protein [Phormidium tenue]MBD2233912.1 hypothetical protein [Phormidium tenue FACHB-1052]